MGRPLLIASLLCTVSVFGITSADAALVISKGKTSNISCDSGICNATAANAVLNVKDLSNMLAASDVSVFAEGVATDITIADPFHWASSHHLTLGAYGSLNVKSTITVEGNAGLKITTNVAGGDGVYRLVNVGKISFWDTQSSLIINGDSYTLVNNLPSLIGQIAANPSGNFALANDYNAAQDGSYPTAAIPTSFQGKFDGLGNAIDKLTIFNTTATIANYGLFAQIASGGQVSNVTLTNFSSQTVSSYVGAIAAINQGTITHAIASGTILGSPGANLDAGGIVYNNQGTVTRSHAAVDVTNALYEGGVAAISTGMISFSDASGNISGGQVAGGLVGESDGFVSECYATGTVTLTGNERVIAGGLAGNATGMIVRSFATGAVSAGASAPHGAPARKPPGVKVGGLVGASSAQILYSYALGSVTGQSSTGAKFGTIGGLVGTNQANGSIFQSYSLGAVILLKSQRYLGGSIGYDYALQGTHNAVYWDLDTSGVTDPAHGAGNVSLDKGLKGVPEDNFRRATIHAFSSEEWAEKSTINNGYPYLIANPPPPQ